MSRRELRDEESGSASPATRSVASDQRIALVVHDQQAIHHVRERGYVESPARIPSILRQLQRTDLFEEVPARHYSEKHIKAVHDADFVNYLKGTCERLQQGESIYPYVFPIRNAARPPKDIELRADYYCMDTFTPIHRNAYAAARRAADCALTAADQILQGRRLAYALVRPPGHHAERLAFGGFCYFNSAAIAAHYLSARGKVAILGCGLPPRERPAEHLLRTCLCTDRFYPLQPPIRLSLLQRV